MTQDDIQEMLAALLAENASTADEKYSEIDITYPLIKIGSDWKIVSLDDTTVKVMCANFKSVKDEISSSLRMTAQIAVLPLQRILPPQAARPLLRAQVHPLILQLTNSPSVSNSLRFPRTTAEIPV